MLILASRSPRRRQLLAHLGLPFRVVIPRVEEDFAPTAAGRPEELAETLALAKAEAVAGEEGEGIVIAADTIVVDGEAILGKPKDSSEATATLRRLRGKTHRVITGLAVVDAGQLALRERRPPPQGGGIDATAFSAIRRGGVRMADRLWSGKSLEVTPGLADHVTTHVRMRHYTDAEIAAYVARGDPLDKAGAYAIQDEAFHPVAAYDGCYCNVVGLPLKALAILLRRAGLDITLESLETLPPQCAACAVVLE
ncbi:MAG: Maf family protein [Dehalococcoidia bacterium]|nr:Maf family protein [Dehalococcoidia bacterium]